MMLLLFGGDFSTAEFFDLRLLSFGNESATICRGWNDGFFARLLRLKCLPDQLDEPVHGRSTISQLRPFFARDDP